MASSAPTDPWNIKKGASQCYATGDAFSDEEAYYAALYQNPDAKTDESPWERRDYTEAAWAEIDKSDPALFSHWRSYYHLPPVEAEVLPQNDAESALRHMLANPLPEQANARYILALMLERKKLFKPIASKNSESEAKLVYEHAKTGEVFLIEDPGLKLEEIARVQAEVAQWLPGGSPTAPANETASETQNTADTADASVV